MMTYLKKPEPKSNILKKSTTPKPRLSEPCIQRKVYIGESEARYEDVLESVVNWCSEKNNGNIGKVERMMEKFIKMDRLTHDDGTAVGVYYFDSMESLLDKLAMTEQFFLYAKVNVGNVGEGDATLFQLAGSDMMVDLGRRACDVSTVFRHKKVHTIGKKYITNDVDTVSMSVFDFNQKLLELLVRFYADINKGECYKQLAQIVEQYIEKLNEPYDKGDNRLQCIERISEAHRWFCQNMQPFMCLNFSREYNSFFARRFTFTDIQDEKNLPLLILITQKFIDMCHCCITERPRKIPFSYDKRIRKKIVIIKEENTEEKEKVSQLLQNIITELGIAGITSEHIQSFLSGKDNSWLTRFSEDVVNNVDKVMEIFMQIAFSYNSSNEIVAFLQQECVKNWMWQRKQRRAKDSWTKRVTDDWICEVPTIITHEHTDHMGGRSGLKQKKNILANSQYSLQDAPYDVIKRLQYFHFTPVSAQWIDDESDKNATSIMTYYDRVETDKRTRIYFLGDIPLKKLQSAEFPPPLEVHMLVFPHHGSKTSNGDDMPLELFGTVKTYGIVSSGAGHKDLLPSCEALCDDKCGLAKKDGETITIHARGGVPKEVIMRSTMNIGYVDGSSKSRVPGYVVFADDGVRSSFYTKAWFPAEIAERGMDSPSQQHYYADRLVTNALNAREKKQKAIGTQAVEEEDIETLT
ncbi:MAG: hypothetical protein K2N73_12770 [Lachnospiraceae bacterium]|nr:hypothetical protein [Lachnospiraceae bacterium]